MDILAQSEPRPRVVIIGAGFGGLEAAKVLQGEPTAVTLVDRQNHHLFQPLLYQVATAGLSPGDISYPVRAVFREDKLTNVLLAEATGVDLDAKCVQLADGELRYDYLILATGARHSYFGNSEWERFAPGLKDLRDALEIRRRILLAFEKAEREADPAEREALLTFVIVGGGPTGVELAGAIAEIAHQVLIDDFREIDPGSTRVILVQGGDRVLPGFPEELSAKAQSALEKLGCWVWTGKRVTDVASDHVMVGEQRVATCTTLWAAGVRASSLGKSLGVELDHAGRVVVNEDLSIPGRPEAFVVGDLASFTDQGGETLPGVAPVAIQQGRHAARNVERLIAGKATAGFEYVDKGSLATIGKAAAVARIGKMKLSGLIAWLAWTFIHLMYLVGFRNRAVVTFSWIWSYVRTQRGARLIYKLDRSP